MANGDVAAASEWTAAYRTWAAVPPPPPRCERPLPSPTAAELCGGPHTRFLVPGRGGEIDTIVRGKPAPSCSATDAATLARLRSQVWRIAQDGRSMACSLGTELRHASVIVQLYAAALPIAVDAFDREQAAKAQQRLKVNEKRNLAGLDPLPPDEPSPEERSWQGGPGFCVALANSTLDAMLADEQSQGFAYTAAVVGDGSWDPRRRRLSRAALLHTGACLGGALAADDLVGGARDNYDAELAHRVDALAKLEGQRVFYIFDSTSPILAGEHFRRLSLPARSRMLCDDWLAWAMAFEQRLETLTYWWSHSHCGHLPEAAVDALAKSFLSGEPVPLPHRALQRLRFQTWTHPKPAGTPCRCCAIPGSLAPGVHVPRSRRPIDGARAVQAVQQREGVRTQGPPQLSSIRSFVTRAREEAFQSSSAALEVSFRLLQDCLARDDDASAALAPTTLGRLLTMLGRLLTTLWRLLMRSTGSTNFLLRKQVQTRSVHAQTRSVHVQTRSGHLLRIARPPSKPPMPLDSRTRRTPAIVSSIRTPIVSRTSRISPPNMSPVLFSTANVQRFDHIGLRKRPRRRGRRQRRASLLRNAGCSRSSVSGGEGKSRRQIQPSSFFSLNDASMRAREPLTWSIGLALLRAGVARTS
jgi:hypothetical protein